MKPLRFLTLILSFTLSLATAGGQVFISEISTHNTEYEDEDTDEPDWLELHNTGDTALDLHGWHLTTSESAETFWTIQHLTLAPKAVRLFFASGKDRPGTEAINETYRPHTDFTLKKFGRYVALLRPDMSVAHDLIYPELGKNVGYGVKDGKEGHLFPATPNAPNTGTPSPQGLAPSVEFSHQGGLFTGSITVTLEVPEHPEAEIQYALNGAEPSLFTPSYQGPITIDKSTTILARTLLPDHLPSLLEGRGYLLMDETLTNYAETGSVFESNLPVLVIDSFGANIDNNRAFQRGYISVITPDPVTGRAVLGGPAEYAGRCSTHLRGESSAGFPQKSYALEIQDAYGEDLDISLLGMPAESDWVLYGPWSEKALMRNKLIFDWMRELRGDDGTSVRSAFCELFFNQRGTESVGDNAYQGVYVLMEKIKSVRERVPVEKFNEHTVDEDMITGGYIIRRDKPDSGKDSWTTSTYNQPLQSFDPDRLNDVQLAYVRGYINSFETALRGDSFTHPTRGYRNYIEPDTFIDAQWFVEITKQVDGYVFSTYWHKARNGKLRAGPLWDFNISMGNADYATGDRAKGWLYDNAGGRGQIWFPRLHADPEYHLAHWDRYWEMRQSIFADDAVDAVIDGHMETLLDGYTEPVGNRAPVEIQNPVARHFRKYPFLGTRQWPNPPAETSIETWQEEVDYMRNWFKDRLKWIDDQSIPVGGKIYRAPRLSHPAGEITSALEVEIIPHKGGLFDGSKYPTETIYYTTDGSDPRLAGGELNSVAQIYEGPIPIEETTTIQARLFHEETWSPKTAGTYLLNHAPASKDNLIISEIMYHPMESSGLETFNGFRDKNLFEYIELTNTSSVVVDLTGVHFTRGIGFEFAGLPAHERLISPGASILLVKHLEAFQRRYPNADPALVRGQYIGKLSNGGERVTLVNAEGEEIVDLRYEDSDPWPTEADGEGYSLVWNGTSESDPNDATAWRISLETNGNPGVHTLPSGSDPDPTPGMDSDGDGLSDVIEIALGSDPQDPQSAFWPRVEEDGPASYRLVQQRRQALGESTLTLQLSRDLSGWEDLEAASAIIETHADGTVTETWPLPQVEDDRPAFVRLRISSP